MTTLWTMLIIVTSMNGGVAVMPGYTYESRLGCEKEIFAPVKSGLSQVSAVCVPYDPSIGIIE